MILSDIICRLLKGKTYQEGSLLFKIKVCSVTAITDLMTLAAFHIFLALLYTRTLAAKRRQLAEVTHGSDRACTSMQAALAYIRYASPSVSLSYELLEKTTSFAECIIIYSLCNQADQQVPNHLHS